MGRLRLLSSGLAIGLTLAACGGGGGGAAPAPPAPVGSSTTIPRPSVHPPPGFGGGLLQDNELSGFVISRVAVYTSAGAFVSSEQLSPADAAAETRMLARSGFRVAAEENLDHQGMAGLSLVERFASSAGARQALRFDVGRFRRIGGSVHDFAFFPVSGVPGAVGFRLGGAGAAGSNVAFVDGDYLYLLGEEGSGAGPRAALGAAGRRLYHRVRG